jgi:hypothetical protein
MNTTPRRRTTLQFSQIRLTLARTFIATSPVKYRYDKANQYKDRPPNRTSPIAEDFSTMRSWIDPLAALRGDLNPPRPQPEAQ